MRKNRQTTLPVLLYFCLWRKLLPVNALFKRNTFLVSCVVVVLVCGRMVFERSRSICWLERRQFAICKFSRYCGVDWNLVPLDVSSLASEGKLFLFCFWSFVEATRNFFVFDILLAFVANCTHSRITCTVITDLIGNPDETYRRPNLRERLVHPHFLLI